MDWMSRRLPERLDPTAVLTGARTVIALAIPYHRPAAEGGSPSPATPAGATTITRTATG